MDGRRIRRVRKPTAWQRWVARWHMWLEDTLEKAVCCGVDPITLAEDTARFSMGGKQASSVFSIRSMSAYMDESDFGDYEDGFEGLSDTESESTDDHLTASHTLSIDMEGRYSFVDCDEHEKPPSVSSDYIPFDDEMIDISHESREDALGGVKLDLDQDKQNEHEDANRLHRARFNCVLAELLMTSHPVGWW